MQALQAATINAAYQALRHPLKRAEYMLSLHGLILIANNIPCMIRHFNGAA